jgi:putative ABC transport system permease protein
VAHLVTDPAVSAAVLILAVVAVIAAVLALRHRLAWRIAMRNVRRGRGRTVLLILGLLVGTSIIAGSLVVGSTVQALDLHYTYLGGGLIHEGIYTIAPSGNLASFPYSVYTSLANQTAGYSDIAGVTPMIMGTTQIYDRTTGVPETNLNLIASDANQSSNLGQFTTTSGGTSAGPGPGQVFIDEQTALALNASVGDSIVVYGPTPIAGTVTAIVVDDLRGGYITAGLTPGNVFLDLGTAQRLENLSGQINFIAVTNVGGQQGGLPLTGTVSAFLNTSLAKIPAAKGLVVHQDLQDAIATATNAGSDIQTIFLVLGLFSIVAGAMLIVGIFLMLAEERKGEMGMLRAVGLRRSDLVYVYYFEGLVYAVGSALAGTLLGVVVGYFLTYTFSTLFASGALTSTAILQSFTVTPDDLVISYVAGFLLTLVTVAIASTRVSRLNIVHAIRDIPPAPPPRRLYTYLLYLGVLVLALGALLFFPNRTGTSDISVPILGGAMIILGLGLIASRFVPNRTDFSIMGTALLVWAGAEPVHRLVLGTSHGGTIFIVFVEGILMVGGVLIVYIFNAAALTNGLLRLAGGGSKGAPVARVALSYPARRPGRTAVTLTIFALVVFTMVAIACFGATIEANLSNTIETESGGYTFFGFSTTPIPTMPETIASNATLSHDFEVAVPVVTGTVNVNVTGSTPNPYTDTLYAAPGNQSANASFYATNQFTFLSTWDGLSRADVYAELASNASVAIVDETYSPPTTNVAAGGSGAPHPTLVAGTVIYLTPPGTTTVVPVRVIGIMTQQALTGVWVNPGTATRMGYTSVDGYLLTIRPGVDANTAAQDAKRAFFPQGLVLFNILAILQSSIASTEGVIGLLEIFVGLGLGVGIAAMGILALRAVVERRREIGMLRAMGFTERAVLKAFFLEYSFVTLLGLGIGVSLGILITYDLSISSGAAAEGVSFFAVPVLNLVEIVIAAYALAMLAIAVPSIRASRLPPAEAVRPTE